MDIEALARQFQASGRNYETRDGDILLTKGLADVHVHFREPGFSYKETIATGSQAAAAGGFTAVCPMPNLSPAPDSPETLALEQHLIRRQAVISVIPYATVTKGRRGLEPVDFRSLKGGVIGFSDDGSGIQDEAVMRRAMELAAENDCIIAAHCEDNSLLRGGYIHDGIYAAAHGHRGICSESEWRPVARDLELAAETGCGYHVCHISTRESLALIRQAKRDGLDVSCETAPHYLLLDENDLQEDGRFKMNPPLRSRADREALLEGICDGTVDMIATDHAPHSAEEKARGLARSAFGVVGLETAFPLLYTGLVLPGVLTLEALTALLCGKPRARFGLPPGADYSLWDLNASYPIDPAEFVSLGRATPFAGRRVFGRCKLTVHDGTAVFYEEP